MESDRRGAGRTESEPKAVGPAPVAILALMGLWLTQSDENPWVFDRADQIRSYQAHLFRDRKLAANTVSQPRGGAAILLPQDARAILEPEPDALPQEGATTAEHPQPKGGRPTDRCRRQLAPSDAVNPLFITAWRSEVRERPASTKRAPLDERRRTRTVRRARRASATK